MTILRTYHHPNHTSTRLSTGLGSSSWITDNTGRPIQHLHYLPFGEDWVDQRNSKWNVPYTFSGKEKDVVSGYGYYGARYYDSGLSIWLSVDPMSDKYPSLSPYNYCSNSPVKRIDPDGLTDYEVDGTIRSINDGNNNLRITVSQRQYKRLERKFNKGGNSYNSYRSKMMEKNGYTTFNNSTYTTSEGIELPCLEMIFHSPKGRGGYRYIDNNNPILNENEKKTNREVNSIDVTGALEIIKSWASTFLETFGSKNDSPDKTPESELDKPTEKDYIEYDIRRYGALEPHLQGTIPHNGTKRDSIKAVKKVERLMDPPSVIIIK